MREIIDRQTFVISVNFATFVPGPPEVRSQVTLPMNLRFAADELVLKSLAYGGGGTDLADVVQIWCNLTNDGLIGAFPNTIQFSQMHDEHFSISNNFQTGNLVLQFQETDRGALVAIQPIIIHSL